jgi:HEAT repeats
MPEQSQQPAFEPEARDNTERFLAFLRQESTAQRDALREDSKANRDALLGTLKIVSYPVAAAIAIIGLLGVKSVSDLKEQLRTTATQEVNRAVETETSRMQKEIRDRLNEQFQTPRLQSMVKDAARDATDAAAAPLIKREVIGQVKANIEAQRPAIHAVVVSETKKGVSELQPRIDAEITQQGSAAEERIRAKIAPYDQIITVSTLAALARNGDATALDNLIGYRNSPDQRIRNLVTSTYNSVYLQYAAEGLNTWSYMTWEFKEPKTKEQLLQLLNASDPMSRKGAMDALAKSGEKTVVPDLMRILRSDPFILVRASAYHGLVQLTGQKFNPLETPGWEQWWEQNKNDWPPKQ